LFELRFAIERIIFQHAMREGHDRAPMLAALEDIIERMRGLSGSGDTVALSSVDLDFHRAVAHFSGNELAAQIWEGLAQHMLIVFCRDWASASDRTGEVVLHEQLIDFIRNGSLDDLDQVLKQHFSDPAHRS
jgi:DNA-binding GntR family transcriptional regulator